MALNQENKTKNNGVFSKNLDETLKNSSRSMELELVLENNKEGIINEDAFRKDKEGRFQQTIQLCCLTVTSGPGTSFSDFLIPSGAKCSVCGGKVAKSRN